MNTVAYIITPSGNISIFVNGKNYTVNKDHMRYEDILNALVVGVNQDIVKLIDVSANIRKNCEQAFGNVIVFKNGIFYHNELPLHTALTNRIVELWKKNYPFNPLLNLLKNIYLNPNPSAISELYEFLVGCDLPITEDGCFLAFKRVRNDYMDYHTGTYDNHVGQKPKMDRSLCDSNRNNECSNGLHFCSKNYLQYYHAGEGRIMVVKVNPKDVVSIPRDYNNTKGRCCEYEVVMELVNNDTKELDEPLYNSDGSKYAKKPDGSNYWNVRGSDGKFTKDYGVKQNGQKFYNVRGPDGKFVSKK